MKDYYIRISQDGLKKEKRIIVERFPITDKLDIDDYETILELLEYGTRVCREAASGLKVVEEKQNETVKEEIKQMTKGETK